MKQLILPLWNDPGISSTLTVCPFSDKEETKPVLLVVPGGGYRNVCRSTEGDPVAARFAELGFRTFILDYRVYPHFFPKPQEDIFRAIRLIRYHAEKFKVYPDQIAVCGFSAGGHLCAYSGIFGSKFPVEIKDEADHCSSQPDAMLLCYPVITSGVHAHHGSFHNLLGESYAERKKEVSLERFVTAKTAPAFIWHTMEDGAVPVENSLLLSEAMRKKKVKHELHLFPSGPHGMQLGYGRADISQWQEQAAAFLYGTCGFSKCDKLKQPKTVVLAFEGSCKSHLKTVAPALKQYGFHATFYTDSVSGGNRRQRLSVKELKKLSDMGFEIGASISSEEIAVSPKRAAQELAALQTVFSGEGIPLPVSFSYPGGTYCKPLVSVLKKHGFSSALTREPGESADPFRISGALMQGDSELLFYFGVESASKGGVPVLVFHGIPDPENPALSCSGDFFRKLMNYLSSNDFRVLSMKEYFSEHKG